MVIMTGGKPMTLRDRLIGGAVDGLMLAIDTIASFWQTPREVEWAKAAADGLAEREAEEEVAEPDGCTCFWMPESTWTKHYGAVEPGSQREWNHECPEHPPTSATTPVAESGPAEGEPPEPSAGVGTVCIMCFRPSGNCDCFERLFGTGPARSAEVEPPASAPSVESPAPEFDWVTTAIPVITGVLAEHMAEQHRYGPVLCHGSVGIIHAEFTDWQGWHDHVAPHIAIAIQTTCVTRTYDFPSGDRPRPLADFPKHQK